MPHLEPQVAYVVSPQPWEGFRVSKHHYASELVKRGWHVYFIDPPRMDGPPGAVEVRETSVPGLWSVRHRTVFPYRVKFHARRLFNVLMARHARRLVRAIGRPPDLVWDFDVAYQFSDLRAFGAPRSIFHLVDDVHHTGLGRKHADLVIYLHPKFRDRAAGGGGPTLHLPHGLGHAYGEAARRNLQRHDVSRPPTSSPQIGYVGNLCAPWVHWRMFVEMVRRLGADATFIFIGPYPAENERTTELRFLMEQPCCRFLGLRSPEEIVGIAESIDVWVLCFEADKTQSGLVNSHKLLEYLSSGSVVVSSPIEASQGSELIRQGSHHDGQDIPEVLTEVLGDLPQQNSEPRMRARMQFALTRTYSRHVEEVLQSIDAAEVPVLSAAR